MRGMQRIRPASSDPGGIVSTTPAPRSIVTLRDFSGGSTFLAGLIPANTLAADGDALEYEVAGQTGAAGGDTVQITLGGVVVFEHGVGANRSWIVRGTIVREASSTLYGWSFSVEPSATGDTDAFTGSVVCADENSFIAAYSTATQADRSVRLLRVKYVPVGTTGEATPPLLQNLEAYYQFEASDGTDRGSAGRDMSSVTGAPTYPAGKVGSVSGQFDGSNYVARPSSDAALQFGSGEPFSVALWFYPTLSGGNPTVFGITDGWQLAYNAANNRIAASSPGGTTLYTIGNLYWGSPSWRHIVLTVDAAGSANLYLDGAFAAGPGYWPNSAGAAALRAAGGRIDEAAIWSRVLSSDEIAALYNGGTGAAIL